MGKKCIGIDVGGTTVKLGLFEMDGTLLEKWEIPTRKEENGAFILPDAAASVKEEAFRERPFLFLTWPEQDLAFRGQ